MNAPRFYNNQIVSAELQINEWVRMVSNVYGGFHGVNIVDDAVSQPYFDDVYMAAYIIHAFGWTLICPTNVSDDPGPKVNGVVLVRTNTPSPENGIYFHEYDIPTSILHGDAYKVVIEQATTLDVHTPFERYNPGNWQPLDPFLPTAIPRDYREWNKVSDTINTLHDTVGLNSQGFVSTYDNEIAHGTTHLHYHGTVRHSESNLLYYFELQKPEQNLPNDTECIYREWKPVCPTNVTKGCWVYYDYPVNEPCSQPGEEDTYGTFSLMLEVQISGGAWEKLMSYNYLILKNQIGSDQYTFEPFELGFLAVGDEIEGCTVTDITGNVVTVDSVLPVRQAHDPVYTTHTNSDEKIRGHVLERFRRVTLQDNVTLPGIAEGDLYSVRVQTYDKSHAGNSHAQLLVGFIGEVPVDNAMSPSWNVMDHWECNEQIGEPNDKLSKIIENVQYLTLFEAINYGSPKLRDPKDYNTYDMVFYRKQRFLAYYNETTPTKTEFSPKITYYDYAAGEWVEDSLQEEPDEWHILDLNSVDGLHTGGFYTVYGTSYVLETGRGI